MGILEALSYGLPCIITPQTNMAKFIQDNNAGWVTKLDAKEIAGTIIRACNQYKNDFIGYSQRAYDLAKQFSWEKIAIESINSYTSVIDKE